MFSHHWAAAKHSTPLSVSVRALLVKNTKMLLPHLLVKLSIVRSLRDREVACSASDLNGLNFESRV